MIPERRDPPHLELVLASRLFGFLVLGAPILWSQDEHALLGLVAVGGVWLSCSVLIRLGVPVLVLGVAEAIGVGGLAGLFAPSMPSLVAAVAFPPLAAGLYRGTRGTIESVLLVAIAVTGALAAGDRDVDPSVWAGACTWLVCGLGVGLLASTFARMTRRTAARGSEEYREARALIRDLTRLSTHLSGGLDAASLAGNLLERVGAVVPTRSLHLHGVRSHQLLLLAGRTTDASTSGEPPLVLVEQAERGGMPRFRGPDFAIPLSTRGVTVAVMSGRLPSDSPASRSVLRRLAGTLEPLALRVDTALMFSELREAASAGERNRLAREIHDGVAQQIASMGYLVDVLAAEAPESMRADLSLLRDQISDVVAEVRHSVTTLRTQVGAQESLGAGVATLARHLSESSGVPITVTIDERTERLRHEVEAELWRIAQEALNNAVKHAHAGQIEVECRVDAPAALLTISDNGVGLGPRRADSYGMTIMAERAALVGARLEVTGNERGGTTVRLSLGHLIGSSVNLVPTQMSPHDVPFHDSLPEEEAR